MSPRSSGEVNPFAAPTIVDTQTPGQAWASHDSPELRRTGTGLSFVYFGIVLILFSIIAFVAMAPFFGIASAFVVGSGLIIGGLMLVIGPILCLAVPAETGAKGLILASVGCQLLNLTANIFGRWTGMPDLVSGVASLLGIVALILFVLFMRRLSLFIGRPDLAKRAKWILILGSAIVVLMAMLFSVRALAAILVLPAMIGGLVVFVMYANLVNALRKILRT